MPAGGQPVDEDPAVGHGEYFGAGLLGLVAGQGDGVRLGAVEGPALGEPGLAVEREARRVRPVGGDHTAGRRGPYVPALPAVPAMPSPRVLPSGRVPPVVPMRCLAPLSRLVLQSRLVPLSRLVPVARRGWWGCTGRHRSITSGDEGSFRTHRRGTTRTPFTHKDARRPIRLRERRSCAGGRGRRGRPGARDGTGRCAGQEGGWSSEPWQVGDRSSAGSLCPCPVCLKSSPRSTPSGRPRGPRGGTRSARCAGTPTRRSRGSCSPSTRCGRSSRKR